MMKKLGEMVVLLTGAACGAVLMLSYGLAWLALQRALGFGLIMFGFSSWGNDHANGTVPVLAWNGIAELPAMLWQQAHTLLGGPDALAGALLGWASALLVLGRGSTGEGRRKRCDRADAIATWVAICVGFFGVMVVVLCVAPALVALAHRPDAHEFGLQQFILGGVVLNPKLWWCALLTRTANRMTASPKAPQVLEAPTPYEEVS